MKLLNTVVFKLGSIEPQGFVESVSGVRQRSRILIFIELGFWVVKFTFCWFCVQLMHGSFCALIKYIAVLKKSYYICSNDEGFGECTDEACGVQYLQ